jgi:hypothetical protein
MRVPRNRRNLAAKRQDSVEIADSERRDASADAPDTGAGHILPDNFDLLA